MTRHFTLPKVLRMTPNRLLCQFFERLQIKLLSLDWRKIGERQVEPMQLALSWLLPEQQGQVESALAQVFEMACEDGWRAILEVAWEEGEPPLTAQVSADSSCYERAMWTWLERPTIFEQALSRLRFDKATRWHKRTGLPVCQPRITPQSLRELAAGLSACLQREEGRGHRCSVEHYRRPDGTDCFEVYPDDFVRTVATHDDAGQRIERPLRPTFEIVFALRAEEGTLELSAKVASGLKPKLERVFGKVILGMNLADYGPSLPYNLNRLKDRHFQLHTDPADHVLASIRSLKLRLPGGRVSFEPDVRRLRGDIYEFIDECLNVQHVHWDEVRIARAQICFEFQPVARQRASTLTIDVTYPDHCHIRSRRPERIALTRKYLRQWRIANA